MARLFDIKLKLPGNKAGTYEDPCPAGSVEFDVPKWAAPNAITWHWKLDASNWEPCPDPRLVPRWYRFGFEGHSPTIDLPIGHNKKENPCAVDFNVSIRRDGYNYQFTKTVWYYTKSCPFHRSPAEEEELERQKWLNRDREYQRDRYHTIRYKEGTILYSRQVNSVLRLVLYELYPTMLTREMMSWGWKGTGEELSLALDLSEDFLDAMVGWANGEGERPDEEDTNVDEPDVDGDPDPEPDDDSDSDYPDAEQDIEIILGALEDIRDAIKDIEEVIVVRDH